jgi:hypothetical protein
MVGRAAVGSDSSPVFSPPSPLSGTPSYGSARAVVAPQGTFWFEAPAGHNTPTVPAYRYDVEHLKNISLLPPCWLLHSKTKVTRKSRIFLRHYYMLFQASKLSTVIPWAHQTCWHVFLSLSLIVVGCVDLRQHVCANIRECQFTGLEAERTHTRTHAQRV